LILSSIFLCTSRRSRRNFHWRRMPGSPRRKGSRDKEPGPQFFLWPGDPFSGNGAAPDDIGDLNAGIVDIVLDFDFISQKAAAAGQDIGPGMSCASGRYGLICSDDAGVFDDDFFRSFRH